MITLTMIVTCPSVKPPSYKLGIPFSKTTSVGNSSIPYSAASFWGRFCLLFLLVYLLAPFVWFFVVCVFLCCVCILFVVFVLTTSSSNLTKTIPCSSRSSSISSKTSRADVDAGCSSCKCFEVNFDSWFISSFLVFLPWRRLRPNRTSLRWTCPESHW